MSNQPEAIATIEVSMARPCILIVDDDIRFLDTAREFFTARDYDVDTARTLKEAEQFLRKGGEDKYQMVATDINFSGMPKMDGSDFVMQNRSLFGKAKKVLISGGAWFTPDRERQLNKAGITFVEKSPTLHNELEEITQQESRKRAEDIEKIVKKEAALRIEEATGRPVNIRMVTTGGQAPALEEGRALESRLSRVVLTRFKQSLIKWLEARREPDKPVLAYGKHIYSANDMIDHVKKETEVGVEHVEMMIEEFEDSLERKLNASRNGNAGNNREHSS